MEISIVGIGSISALGHTPSEIAQSYRQQKSYLSRRFFDEKEVAVGVLSSESQQVLTKIKNENRWYKDTDTSVHMAIYAAREAIRQSGWQHIDQAGVNIGSSRGATALFEHYYDRYRREKYCSVLTSPTTTLGNIASWVAQDLGILGFAFSHSITCSTALHALINAVAWLKSGMADYFLAGGSEAPLTGFTIAQMKALKIYSEQTFEEYPCRSLDLLKTLNTMVLGEGAAVAALERGVRRESLAVIRGVGFSVEQLSHHISISAEADCLQRSMESALSQVEKSSVDVVVLHAPGTIKGDISEVNAIKAVFGEKLPALASNKWKIGHTFGASGMLSVEMALEMFRSQQLIEIPYLSENKTPRSLRRILVNAVGFGGNAASVLLEKV